MYISVKETNESFCYDKSITLLENFKKNNIKIKSGCGGFGKCLDCKIEIVSDNAKLPSLTLEEEQALGNVYFITKERLSCQLKNIDIEDELKVNILNRS